MDMDSVKFPLLVMNVIVAAAGVFGVFYLSWGVYMYLTSDGSSNREASGRRVMAQSLVGLLMVVAALGVLYLASGLVEAMEA